MGYALAFAAGTIFSGSAVYAATTYVQALKETTTMKYHDSVISKPTGLVYGDTTYVQLYSIQQALKQAGINNGWDGSTLTMTDNTTAKLSNGTTDALGTYLDIGYSVSYVMNDTLDFVKAGSDSKMTPESITSETNQIITSLQDNLASIQNDTTSDTALANVQKEYVRALNDYITAFQTFATALQTQSDATLNQFDTELNQATADFDTAMNDFRAYQPPEPTGTVGAARFSNGHGTTHAVLASASHLAK